MFDDRSRYNGLPVNSYTGPDGVTIRYVSRRILPDPVALRTPASLRVVEGDRLDLIANRALGDPTFFWRIADANAALDPDLLLQPAGRMLAIPSPV
jgi:hypothetical protein